MNFTLLLRKYKATIAYIITIVVVNVLYSYLPYVSWFNNAVSPADAIVGAIYIARDFAQREIKHKVMIAMFVGAVLSYLMAAEQVAFASVVAFSVGETIDWLIFTFTRKPLSERLLWSAIISTPIDSYVFLSLLANLNWVEFCAMTLAKILGVVLVWLTWKRRNRQPSPQYQAARTGV